MGCALTQSNDDIAPEPASPLSQKQAVTGNHAMVVTANPYATDVATAILRQGGNALDAAIAAQMVLGLVEPQSSGIGGGGFLLYWNAAKQKLHSYDGRETAPSTASPTDFLHTGKPLPFMQAVKSSKAVGIPALIPMLGMAHQHHGKKAWSRIMAPAAKLAAEGFIVSPRLHQSLHYAAKFPMNEGFKALYFRDGAPVTIGETLRNPAYAHFLQTRLSQGASQFTTHKTALELHKAIAPERLSVDDFMDYAPKKRAPICANYRNYKICGMAPPSSGGSTVLQTLKLLEPFALNDAYASDEIHLILEAMKLAFADRNHYIADPDFVEVPLHAILSDSYLKQRRQFINPHAASTTPFTAGNLGERGQDNSYDSPSTTHLSIVDAQGNAVSLTSSVEHGFGSSIVSEPHGFVMNNQLTDFAFVPEVDGKAVANRMQPKKRPRSSMSPTMVFDKNGKLLMVIGSPGGSSIIGYVLKTLIAVLDWNMPLQAAIDAPNFVQKNREHATIETGFSNPEALEKMGHRLKQGAMTSGIHAIMRTEDGQWIGAADPRREGKAYGY